MRSLSSKGTRRAKPDAARCSSGAAAAQCAAHWCVEPVFLDKARLGRYGKFRTGISTRRLSSRSNDGLLPGKSGQIPVLPLHGLPSPAIAARLIR